MAAGEVMAASVARTISLCRAKERKVPRAVLQARGIAPEGGLSPATSLPLRLLPSPTKILDQIYRRQQPVGMRAEQRVLRMFQIS
jgi:hypothetical protein